MSCRRTTEPSQETSSNRDRNRVEEGGDGKEAEESLGKEARGREGAHIIKFCLFQSLTSYCASQAETINRLLKKQSRGKGRRNALATAEDRDTPIAASRGEAEDEEGEGSAAPIPIIPTMYRWSSSVKEGENGEKQMVLSFAVPISVVPVPDGDETSMDVDPVPVSAVPPPQSERPTCDVSGCKVPRKYRLVKDWQKGACGMEHLKVLEAQVVS